MPDGWEQGVTTEGEVYFINHVTKTTTWFDPRIPIANQTVPVRIGQQQPPALCALNSGGAQSDSLDIGLTPAQKRQQDTRLQRLENERRVLQQRQAERKLYMDKQVLVFKLLLI